MVDRFICISGHQQAKMVLKLLKSILVVISVLNAVRGASQVFPVTKLAALQFMSSSFFILSLSYGSHAGYAYSTSGLA